MLHIKLFIGKELTAIVLLILLCPFAACREEKDKSSFNKKNYIEHYIDDIKGTLLLSLKYQRITSENQAYIFSKVDSTSSLRQMINYLDESRLDYVLFTKNDDLSDFVLIHKTDHINFSKQDANRYLDMVEQVMSGNYGYQNYSRLQDKMTRTERSKYIKVKYKIDYNLRSVFRTQYVVTSKISTFEVIEMRQDITDYEDLIKRIDYVVN